jgi:hypothetical protein
LAGLSGDAIGPSVEHETPATRSQPVSRLYRNCGEPDTQPRDLVVIRTMRMQRHGPEQLEQSLLAGRGAAYP